jgi:hypothetical protein
MDGALRGGRVWWRSGTSSVSPGERSRKRRSEEVEGHAVRYAAGRCRRVGEYSTEVQQLTRTRAHSWGRGRTVTCGDGRGWTCCRQMACKRSGVRISLAPPGQKHNSNDSNSKYSSKVQQRRPDGPPYVCVFGSVSSAGTRGWQDRGVQSLLRCLQAYHLGKFLFSGRFDTCRLGRHPARASGQPDYDCCRVCRWCPYCRPPASTIHSEYPQRSPADACSRIAPVGSVVAPDGADQLVRCAAQALGCAVAQSGAVTRRAVAPAGERRAAA